MGDHSKKNPQEGSTLLVTLLIMVSITIIGIMSLNTSAVDIQIEANEKQIQQTFYLAEAGLSEAVQRISALSPAELQDQKTAWYHSLFKEGAGSVDFRNPLIWDADGIGMDNATPTALSVDTYFAAVEWDTAAGGSLIQSDYSHLYQVRIYSLCTLYGVNSLVEIGYLHRY